MRSLKEAKQTNEKYYLVIASKENPYISKGVLTKREPINLKFCQELSAKINKFFLHDKIEIIATKYDYNISEDEYLYVQSGDIGLKTMGNEKIIYFYPHENIMRIWMNGNPIYENNNGTITRDEYALADCLL